jgi:hypothetical protein
MRKSTQFLVIMASIILLGVVLTFTSCSFASGRRAEQQDAVTLAPKSTEQTVKRLVACTDAYQLKSIENIDTIYHVGDTIYIRSMWWKIIR